MPTALPLRAGDPARLGPYTLAGLLGEGGQGVVYLAEDAHGTKVAIKVLHAADRDELRREIEAARKVARFSTAPVLDADLDAERPYVVSEYVDGPSLQEIVTRDGPRDPAVLERIAIGTATALAAIHRAGVVHRDFKPANVLLGAHGPQVIDFGIARNADLTAGATQGMSGTPLYMSPEQLSGQGAGAASDVFAWAATMLYAATGTAAFQAPTLPAVYHRIINHRPDVSPLPSPLREVVGRALAKRPEERPTAQELMLALVEQGPGEGAIPTRAVASPYGKAAGTGSDGAQKGVPGTGEDGASGTGRGRARGAATVPARRRRWAIPGAVAAGAVVLTAAAIVAPRLSAATPTRTDPPTTSTSGTASTTTSTTASTSTGTTPPANPQAKPLFEGPNPYVIGQVKPDDVGALGSFRGRPIAVTNTFDKMRVYDVLTGDPVTPALTGFKGLIFSSAFATIEGKEMLVTGGERGELRRWDIAAGKQYGDTIKVMGAGDLVTWITTGTLDGRPVALLGGIGNVARLWDLKTGKPIGAGIGPESPDNGGLGSLGGRATVTVGDIFSKLGTWNAATRASMGSVADSAKQTSKSLVVVGDTAIAGGLQGRLIFWNLATGRQIAKPVKAHESGVLAIATGKLDGVPVALTGGGDKTVRLWDLRTGKPIGKPLLGHTAQVQQVMLAEYDGVTVAVTRGGDVRVWNLKELV
ncbi:serine/threonine-protein kinase [Nonomuraea sp. NBC_01738]|uniref:WD40 repeat domain-containing serine/threonine protein kinase n=1 Tax=Nonomuraea sp. NBC_01738 TaxID=2976003 RepID=UPI002E140F9A|nr:serine/threonine-protein kinase [Nonomuraea sp. NBC_01738]